MSVSVSSLPFVCVQIFSSVFVTDGPPSGKEPFTRLTVRAIYSPYICNFCNFPFWFLGHNLGLIVSVPGHCLSSFHFFYDTVIIVDILFVSFREQPIDFLLGDREIFRKKIPGPNFPERNTVYPGQEKIYYTLCIICKISRPENIFLPPPPIKIK